MRKQTVTVEYEIKGQRLAFEFDHAGDLVTFAINDIDRSDDGDAIESALAAVAEAGHKIQRDISDAFDELTKNTGAGYRTDWCRLAKSHAELKMVREMTREMTREMVWV